MESQNQGEGTNIEAENLAGVSTTKKRSWMGWANKDSCSPGLAYNGYIEVNWRKMERRAVWGRELRKAKPFVQSLISPMEA